MAATLISCGAFVPLAVKWLLHTRRVSRIKVKALVTSSIIQSVCLVGKGRLKKRCRLEPKTNFFFFRLRNRQKLVRIRFENIHYMRIHVYCDDKLVRWKYDRRHIHASVQFHSLAVLVHRTYTDFKITGWVSCCNAAPYVGSKWQEKEETVDIARVKAMSYQKPSELLLDDCKLRYVIITCQCW